MKQKKVILLIILISLAVALLGYTLWKQHFQTASLGFLSQGIASNRQQLTSIPEPSSQTPQDISTDENSTEHKQEDTNLATDTIQQEKLAIIQSVQENNYYCVPACIQMTLRYHAVNLSQSELAQQLHTDPVTGTEYADMAAVLNTYLFHKDTIPTATEAGYRVQTMKATDDVEKTAQVFAQRCEQNIKDGYPVFAAVDLHALYPSLPQANHMVLVHGYQKEHNRITSYYILDPYPPVQDAVYQGLKTFTAEELIHAMLVNEEPAYIW